jgi:tetratricopeptide (TPR) repeat protein
MKRNIVIALCLCIAAAAFAAGSGAASTGGGSSSGGSSNPGAQTAMKGPSAMDLYNQGYAAWKQGKWSDAAKYFQNAISVKSDYAEAYSMLGFCTRKLGDATKAIGYYETALKLKPNFPEAREYFGEAYLQQGNLAKAVQQYIWLEKAGSKNAKELLEKISDYVSAM